MRPNYATRMMPPEIETQWNKLLQEGSKVPIIVEEFGGDSIACLVEWGDNFQRYNPTPKEMAQLLIEIDLKSDKGKTAYILPGSKTGTLVGFVTGNEWDNWLSEMRGYLRIDEVK